MRCALCVVRCASCFVGRCRAMATAARDWGCFGRSLSASGGTHRRGVRDVSETQRNSHADQHGPTRTDTDIWDTAARRKQGRRRGGVQALPRLDRGGRGMEKRTRKDSAMSVWVCVGPCGSVFRRPASAGQEKRTKTGRCLGAGAPCPGVCRQLPVDGKKRAKMAQNGPKPAILGQKSAFFGVFGAVWGVLGAPASWLGRNRRLPDWVGGGFYLVPGTFHQPASAGVFRRWRFRQRCRR